jgi:methylated-DNA-[protein]-cysteine S-methyltransferase
MLSFETELGRCGLRWSAAGITEVLMPGRRELADRARGSARAAPVWVHEAGALIAGLLAGERRDLTRIVLAEQGLDPFARRVFAATRGVSAGTTTTYGELARAVAQPGAARAVGTALARNPFPIIVPCHRVLAADGSLHGFSAPGGIATKQRILEIERAPGFCQTGLFA